MKVVTQEIKIEGLSECGRLQYFYHCPSSLLPIRDVLNEQGEGFKTEPHIEIGGENFLKSCFQSSIKSHTEGPERYLFLMTTCRNPDIQNVYGVKSIVGYIDKRQSGIHAINGKGITFVLGETHLFSFEHALPITDLGYSNWTRLKKVNEEDTKTILSQFNGLDNIIDDCIAEIQRIDSEGKTCIEEGKDSCYFKDMCRRYS